LHCPPAVLTVIFAAMNVFPITRPRLHRAVRRCSAHAIGVLASLRSRRALEAGLRAHPDDVRLWLALIDRNRDQLSPHAARLVAAHNLKPHGYVVNYLAARIGTKADLAALACDPGGNLGAAIEEIVRWKTILQCGDAHIEGGYFAAAEPEMDVQWRKVIWPIIKDCDFAVCLDLACGHGRNSERLRQHASVVHMVDINQTCLDACEVRFGRQKDSCRFFYHRTDGNHLRMLHDGQITFGYSWDSMVHFDKLVMRDYVLEFARVLRPGATAFLHHSNLGTVRPDSDWAANNGTRSDMTAELMCAYAAEAGLKVRFQRLSGLADGWGTDDLDCLSLVEKPS
jgi:SAM-dependent methyltransferase